MIIARPPYTPSAAPASYDPAWVRTQLAGLSRAIKPANVRTVKAATTITVNDDLLLCDATAGAFPVTLLPANQCQFLEVTIKKSDASGNAVTISGTLDGVLNPTLAAQYKSKTVQSDGTSWWTKASV